MSASRLRWLIIITGAACFLWLSTEDTHTLPVAVLGSALAFCLVMLWLHRQQAFDTLSGVQTLAVGTLAGGLVGVGAATVTTLLMFLKTAWHSHLFPDFPTLMMLAMLERAPLWGLAGALQGLALAVIWPPDLSPAALQIHSQTATTETLSQSLPD